MDYYINVNVRACSIIDVGGSCLPGEIPSVRRQRTIVTANQLILSEKEILELAKVLEKLIVQQGIH